MDKCNYVYTTLSFLTFIPTEDMTKTLIGFTSSQFMPHVLVNKIIRIQ